MAMRPRTPTHRTQLSLHPVYENVQPKSEMKENEEAYLLHVYLPGFTKDGIRITYVGSARMARVVGERPIDGGNRWSRFDQTYPIPENCEVERLQGKLEKGILTITMPKKLISQVTPKAEVKTTQEKGPSPSNKDVAEPKSKIAKEAIPQKSTTNRVEEPIGDKKSPSLPSTVKSPTDLMAQKGTQKDTSPAHRPNRIGRKPEHGPHKYQEEAARKTIIIAATPKEQTGKPQKAQEEIEPKPTSTTDSIKEIDEKRREEIRQKAILATVRNQLDGKAGKESVTKKEVNEEYERANETIIKPEKYMDHQVNFKGKEIRARKPKAAETSAPKAPEKETRRSDLIGTIGKGVRELATSASQVVTRIGEGKLNDQDKPSVANMGAAIIVIVALGAYVSYKFASSERT